MWDASPVYPLANGRGAFAVLGKNIHHTHFVKLRRRQHVARENQFLGRAHSDTAREQAVRTHPGKEVEQDLREAEARAFLCDDDVGGVAGQQAAVHLSRAGTRAGGPPDWRGAACPLTLRGLGAWRRR